jgi:hypothetical protein
MGLVFVEGFEPVDGQPGQWCAFSRHGDTITGDAPALLKRLQEWSELRAAEGGRKRRRREWDEEMRALEETGEI